MSLPQLNGCLFLEPQVKFLILPLSLFYCGWVNPQHFPAILQLVGAIRLDLFKEWELKEMSFTGGTKDRRTAQSSSSLFSDTATPFHIFLEHLGMPHRKAGEWDTTICPRSLSYYLKDCCPGESSSTIGDLLCMKSKSLLYLSYWDFKVVGYCSII